MPTTLCHLVPHTQRAMFRKRQKDRAAAARQSDVDLVRSQAEEVRNPAGAVRGGQPTPRQGVAQPSARGASGAAGRPRVSKLMFLDVAKAATALMDQLVGLSQFMEEAGNSELPTTLIKLLSTVGAMSQAVTMLDHRASLPAAVKESKGLHTQHLAR